jgi:hyperosmotically inducible periplasmic protein
MKKIVNCSSVFLIASGLFLMTGSFVQSSETDARIESAAKNSYVFKTYLKEDAIKTESQNGVVTLQGSVSSVSHKYLAENTVAAMPGVVRIENQLIVKQEIPEEHSDAWITVKVKTALLFHRSVSASKTGVEVKDGVVFLTGEASSQAQKELTAEYAYDIDHVKEVRNGMTVVSNPDTRIETLWDKVDDASITAQVKMSLMSHRSTSVLKTNVATKDGAVTLGGVAKNNAEKKLVSKLVNDIYGVTSVNNNMTVSGN